MKIDQIYYINAVNSLCGGGVGGPVEGPISRLNFDDSGNLGVKAGYTLPTESEIQTELVRLQAEYDALAYSRNRASSSGYPSIPEQLDEIYHNGIDSWKAVIKVTKDKYPK